MNMNQKERSDDNSSDNQLKGSNKTAANPKVIGLPFHNPYTFIPFPKSGKSVRRDIPLPLTADELDMRLKTGILELQIETISPLLCSSVSSKAGIGEKKRDEVGDVDNHKKQKAHVIEEDVVLPASSIRGALRNLMTIITGGTLGPAINENLYLCQGRDTQLGPSQINNAIPNEIFLAEVIRRGDSLRSGLIKLGTSRLVKLSDLTVIDPAIDKKRPRSGEKIRYNWIDDPVKPTRISPQADDSCKWKLKLSGRKVNTRDVKGKDEKYRPPVLHEGVFLSDGEVISLPKEYWAAYEGRNKFGARKSLQNGDLIWLEPKESSCKKIAAAIDIKSIQWARWGRSGKSFSALIKEKYPHLESDTLRTDGKVDWVTDLFGQIPSPSKAGASGPFAARLRPHNLIFYGAKSKITKDIPLAPLSAPHPGCIAFYRNDTPDDINQATSDLKGYKVYRTTNERGNNAPWHYPVQGIYDAQGRLKNDPQNSVNSTADLLNQGVSGKLRIAFRSIFIDDLALLLAISKLDWRLGGGKPLGLGHCRVTSWKVINEDGRAEDPFNPKPNDTIASKQLLEQIEQIENRYKERISLYKASQLPVDCLRYPRAVKKNKNANNRSGLSWFSRHAAPKKNNECGLQTLWTQGELKNKIAGNNQIRAQMLPILDSGNKNADLLYGYDGYGVDEWEDRANRKFVGDIEPFDEEKHKHKVGLSSENLSPNKKTRQTERDQRE